MYVLNSFREKILLKGIDVVYRKPIFNDPCASEVTDIGSLMKGYKGSICKCVLKFSLELLSSCQDDAEIIRLCFCNADLRKQKQYVMMMRNYVSVMLI